MKKVMLDDALRSKLGDLTEDVQVCDERGITVGMVLPRSEYYRLLMLSPEAQVSDEELEQAFAEPGGQTLAEIKKELGME